MTEHLSVRPEACFFWGTHGGAELDLLVLQGGRRLGFEFKRTEAPSLTRSMRSAMEDLNLDRRDVDERARVGLQPAKGVTLTGDLHLLHLQQQHGTWSDALGARMDDLDYDTYYGDQPGPRRRGGRRGGVADAPPRAEGRGGVSRFLPGQAAFERRGGADSTWAFVSLEVALKGSTAPPVQ